MSGPVTAALAAAEPEALMACLLDYAARAAARELSLYELELYNAVGEEMLRRMHGRALGAA